MFNNQMMNNGMQMGQANLPFQYNQTTNMPIMGTPDSPSSYPSFNVIGPMMQYYRTLVGFCMHEVQINTGKNHLRVFTFNAMSSNNWNNQFFGNMVVFTAEYALFLHMSQRMDIRSAIARAAADAGNWFTAYLSCNFMNQGLPIPQEMLGELQNLIRAYETMMGVLNNFKQHLQQQNMQQQQQNNWQNNQGFVQQQSAPMNNTNQAVFNNSGMFTNNPSPSVPANSDLGGLAMLPSMGNSFNDDKVVKQQSLEEIHFSPNAQAQTVATVNRSEPVVDNKPNLPLRYNNLFHASKCKGVVRNWSEGRSHALAYNPDTHVLFLELDAGQTNGIEVIKTIEEVGMEYIDHELDCSLQMKAFSNQLSPRRHINVDWDNVKNSKRTADIEKENNDIKVPVKGVFNTEKIVACSLEQAIQIIKMRLNDKSVKLSENATISFIYRHLTPFFIDEKDVPLLDEIKEIINKLDDFTEVYTLLDGYIGKLPVDIWHFINNKMTAAVNKELKIGIGLSTQIGDFHEDFKELNKKMSSKGAGVVSAFHKAQKNIIANVFRNLKGDSLKKYLSAYGGNTNNEIEKNHIIFLEDHFTVLVPWLSNKLNVVMREKAGAVMESFLPEFYDACKNIVEKSKEVRVHNQMIVTADGVKIAIDEPVIGVNIYIVSRV